MPAKKLRGKKKKKPVVAEKHPGNLPNYQLGKMLGKGAFGEVYQGLDLTNGSVVAIKTIQLKRFPDAMKGARDEIELMSALKHDNIIKYIGSEKTDEFLYIIMEFAEGGSIQSIQKKYNFDEHLVATYVYQMLLGLKYLHEQAIIHRDIKAANILISHNVAKLSDFGISVKINEGAFSPSDANCSPYWAAPEVILMESITEKADIWSLGITAIEMFTGSPPYYDLDPIPAMYKIAQPHETDLPNNITDNFRNFLTSCLNRTVEFRKSTDELLEDPWILQHTSPNYVKPLSTKSSDISSALLQFEETGDDDVFNDGDDDQLNIQSLLSIKNSSPLQPITEAITQELPSIDRFATDDEDEDDIFDGDQSMPLTFAENQLHKLNEKELVFQYQDEDLKIKQEMENISQILIELPDYAQKGDTDTIYRKCLELADYFDDPKVSEQIINYHCLVPLVTVIQTPEPVLLSNFLTICHALLEQTKISEGICVLGVLPSLFDYSINEGNKYGREMQIPALGILKRLTCDLKTDEPLRMFIAAGGLSEIPKILRENPHKRRPEYPNTSENPDVTYLILEIVSSVLFPRKISQNKISLPTSSFIRILGHSGAVELFGERYVDLNVTDKGFTKLCEILLEFSKGDTTVKMRMATPKFIKNIFSKAKYTLNIPPNTLLSNEQAEMIFSALHNLSMDKGVVQLLWRTTLADELVNYLHITGMNQQEIQISNKMNLCFSTLYHLSRVLTDSDVPHISPLIPMTIYIITHNGLLKEHATQLFLEFIKSHSQDEQMRLRLLQNNGISTLFTMLSQHSHKEEILAAFEAWSRSSPISIENYLVKEVDTFVETLENILRDQPDIRKDVITKIQHICAYCPKLTAELAQSNFALFIHQNIIEADNESSADIRLEFCTLLITLYQAHPNPKVMIAKCRLDLVAYKYMRDQSDSVKACARQLQRAVASNYIL